MFFKSDITDELKAEVQYLAEEYLRQFTSQPMEISIGIIDNIILEISIEPFYGRILIYELDKSLHKTSMRKWTHSTSCNLMPCSVGSDLYHGASRYGLMDIIQIAMIDLMDQIEDAIEDLPIGHFGV